MNRNAGLILLGFAVGLALQKQRPLSLVAAAVVGYAVVRLLFWALRRAGW